MWGYYFVICFLFAIPLTRWYLKKNPTLKVKGYDVRINALPDNLRRLTVFMILVLITLLCPVVALEFIFTSVKNFRKVGKSK